MLAGFIALTFLLSGVDGDYSDYSSYQEKLIVTMDSYPREIEPGVTPDFVLGCQAGPYVKGEIMSFSISRRALTVETDVSPKEFIVEIRGVSPTQTTVAPGYENLDIRGMITISQEYANEISYAGYERTRNLTDKEVYLLDLDWHNRGKPSYLRVTWPEPKVQDLGVYTCDATFQESGTNETLSAETKLSASITFFNEVLAKVLRNEKNQDVLNQTLSRVQSDIGSLRTDLEGCLKTGNDSWIKTSSETVNVTKVTICHNDTTTEGVVTEDPAPHVLRLTSALENLEVNFKRFNEILERVDKIIATLEEKVEQVPSNTTTDGKAVYPNVSHSFTYEGNLYALYDTGRNLTLNEAQVKCENQSGHLAEVTNITDFSYITGQIDPNVETGRLVFVGGQKTREQDQWTFRSSNHSIEFFNLDLFDGDDTSDGDECLALRKSLHGWSTVFVACSKIKHPALFLCSRASNSTDL